MSQACCKLIVCGKVVPCKSALRWTADEFISAFLYLFPFMFTGRLQLEVHKTDARNVNEYLFSRARLLKMDRGGLSICQQIKKTRYSLPENIDKINDPIHSHYLFSCTFNKNVIFLFLLLKLQGIFPFLTKPPQAS